MKTFRSSDITGMNQKKVESNQALQIVGLWESGAQ